MARTVAGTTGGRTNRKFLIVAVLFGALTAALFYALTARGGDTSTSSAPSAGDQQVVVAKIPIQQRTTITADMLEVKNVPLNTVITGAFTSMDDAVGKVTKFPIETNQQVIGTAVIDTAHPVTDAGLSLIVPDGKRAFSISANQVLTAGGLLLPGDYVDVVWVCCKNGIEWQGNGAGKTIQTSAIILSRPVVQNVQIAAVAQNIVNAGPADTKTPGASATSTSGAAGAKGGGQADATTITLLVTEDQANILFLAENTGTLRAALRNPGDQALIPFPSETQFITPGLIPPELMKVIQDTFTKQ